MTFSFTSNGKMPSFIPIDKDNFALADDLKVWIDKYCFVIPAGFVTNFRSGPSIADLVLPKWGTDISIAVLIVIHDYFYSIDCCPILSRKESDNLLKEGLIYMNYSKLKANLVYRALRLFGESHFKKEFIRVWNPKKQAIENLNTSYLLDPKLN